MFNIIDLYLFLWRYRKCDALVDDINSGRLQCQPGCSIEQTFEAIMLKDLSLIRDYSGKSCSKLLAKNNSPLVMAHSGAKGSLINVAQMVICVGQQAINNHRVEDHTDDRTIYHFQKTCKFF